MILSKVTYKKEEKSIYWFIFIYYAFSRCFYLKWLINMKQKQFVNENLLKMYSPPGCPKCITSLAHQWILCNEWLPSEWVRMADKNIIIHTKSTQIQSKWNKSNIFLPSLFPSKNPISITAFSSEKVVLSESREKYAQIEHRLQAKTVQNSSKKWWWIFW